MSTVTSEEQFTYDWWTRVCSDEGKLIAYLQKLQRTEANGFDDNWNAIKRFTNPDFDKAAIAVLKKTADDEQRHGDLLAALLERRGEVTIPDNDSYYWNEMDKVITDLESCAAVFHMGEGLAAFRFNIMLKHPDTPIDVLAWLKVVTPDEDYHCKVFKKLTTDQHVITAKSVHDRILSDMKTGKSKK